MLRMIVLASVLALAPAQEVPSPKTGEVFDEVVKVLTRYYKDKDFVAETLPGLVAGLSDRAHEAPDFAAEREVVNELLAQIQTSHLALISIESYHQLGAELFGNTYPTFGLQLAKSEGRYFATWIFEGGPAALAGVMRGDQVLSIDGVHPARSERLDWSTDDAALDDLPLHALRAEAGDSIRLQLERTEGQTLSIEVEAIEYSGSMAAEASARIIEEGGQRFGYVHFWYIQPDKPSELLERLLTGEFSDCDGLVVDLRGRGGSVFEVARITKLLDPKSDGWGRPMVALTDRGTRSAKEVIAYRIQSGGYGKIVGERSAGAVVPAAFREVGGGAVLMFPSMALGDLSELLEGKGVTPDVSAVDHLPHTAGADPILKAGIETLKAALSIAGSER